MGVANVPIAEGPRRTGTGGCSGGLVVATS